jgi:hypothetical protein
MYIQNETGVSAEEGVGNAQTTVGAVVKCSLYFHQKSFEVPDDNDLPNH